MATGMLQFVTTGVYGEEKKNVVLDVSGTENQACIARIAEFGLRLCATHSSLHNNSNDKPEMEEEES
eukprot:11371289-Ditylum_brightwellii.AAC.1